MNVTEKSAIDFTAVKKETEIDPPRAPGLLVSVRDATEAALALRGGADWIDVKEPTRGPLGAADPDTIAAVVECVGGRVPVSAAAGELLDQPPAAAVAGLRGVGFVKLGLAGCASVRQWSERWHAARSLTGTAALIAVAYADWQRAHAPPPTDVLHLAAAVGAPAVLVDTYDKSACGLLDVWPVSELAQFVASARRQRVAIALAGKLRGAALRQAAQLVPDWIAVRGAACDAGRCGRIALRRVVAVRRAVAEARRSEPGNVEALSLDSGGFRPPAR